MSSHPRNAPHTVEVGLRILDRQLIDKDGEMAGKVDDLEFTERDKGPPVLTAILAGPGAVAPRLGRAATWIAARRVRLSRGPKPPTIDFGLVKKIGPEIELTVSRDELDSITSERWAARIVERIPGAE